MLDKLKGHLIEDWKEAHKFLSIQLAALLFIVSEAFEYLPAAKEYLPEGWVKYIAIAIIAARLYSQKKKVAE